MEFGKIDEKFFEVVEVGFHERLSEMARASDCSELGNGKKLQDSLAYWVDGLKNVENPSRSTLELAFLLEKMRNYISASKSLSVFAMDLFNHQRKHFEGAERTELERMLNGIVGEQEEIRMPTIERL